MANQQHRNKKNNQVDQLFTDSSVTSVNSSLPLIEASNILSRGSDLPWQTDPDGKLSYSRDFDNGRGAIHFWVTSETNLPANEKPSGLATAAALAVINSFDIRAACMHLIYAAYATQNASNEESLSDQEIVIDDRQLEKFLGLQKRTDLNRQEKLSLIRELAEQPCRITTFVALKSSSQQKGFTISEGRLWHLTETRYHYQQDLLGDTQQLEGITFVIKPGSWAKHYLTEDQGRRTHISRTLLEKIMGIWQHREGAARLMIWLIFKAQKPANDLYAVSTLMEVAYGTQRLNDAQNDRKIRARVSNTWDEDLLFLHDQGWSIAFDDTSYPLELRPPGFGRSLGRRPSGFFEKLLDASLSISTPPEWSTPQMTASSSDTSAIEEISLLPGSKIKEERNKRSWSQRKLAQLTGISQSRICRIEGGKPLTPDENNKIQRVFDYM